MTAALSRDLAFSVIDPALSSLFIVRVPFTFSRIEVIAEQCSATFQKTPAEPRHASGSNEYYPGVTDIDGLSITFYETRDYKVSSWLNQWRALVYNRLDGEYGVASAYKKTMYVELYAQGQASPVRTLTYLGCWPTDQSPYELNYEEETGRITVQAQFSVDDGYAT